MTSLRALRVKLGYGSSKCSTRPKGPTQPGRPSKRRRGSAVPTENPPNKAAVTTSCILRNCPKVELDRLWAHLVYTPDSTATELACIASAEGAGATAVVQSELHAQGRRSMIFTSRGQSTRLYPATIGTWPRGSADALLLLQRGEDGLPRFAFIAHSTVAMWLVVDLLFEREAADGRMHHRIILANFFKGLKEVARDGGAAIRSAWYTVTDPEAIHHEARRAGCANTETVNFQIVRVVASTDEAFAIADRG
jgi:hypothetical protein